MHLVRLIFIFFEFIVLIINLFLDYIVEKDIKDKCGKNKEKVVEEIRKHFATLKKILDSEDTSAQVSTHRNTTRHNSKQFRAPQDNTTQHSATQRNTAQHSATQRSATQCNTTQHNTT